jgi:hypothetical protein
VIKNETLSRRFLVWERENITQTKSASMVDVLTLVFVSWSKIASANVHFSFV